jgi:hypothetical protein
MSDQIKSRIQWIENRYNADNDIIPNAPLVTATEMAMLEILKELAKQINHAELLAAAPRPYRPTYPIQQLPPGYNIEQQTLAEWNLLVRAREILNEVIGGMTREQAAGIEDRLMIVESVLHQVQDSINVRILHGHGPD